MAAEEVKPLSKAERIANLNEIDQDIVKLLGLASTAVGLLTKDDYGMFNPKLDDVKEQFKSISAEYAAKLSAIEVKTRREVHALEEAELIAAGTKRDSDRATLMNEDQLSRRPGGPLDSSWLNARAKDTIGRGLRREVLDDAAAFLRKNNMATTTKLDPTDSMQVDNEDSEIP